jgi:V/A-type H+-transporting ATPase subunit F
VKLVVVTRPGDGLGFRLAGVAVEEVADGGEADALAPLFADPQLGVLAVETSVHVPPALLARAARRGLPIVFPFALPRRWPDAGAARSYVGALIQRAIGYHVRLS